MLLSAIQQHVSKYTCITSFLSLLPPPRPHPTPLGHHRAWAGLPVLSSSFPLALYFTHGGVYSLNSSHSLPSLLFPQVHSLQLCLYSCLANRLISTIFSRFHIYELIYIICFSLSDLLHCQVAFLSITGY